MQSYTSGRLGIFGRYREVSGLHKAHRSAKQRTEHLIACADDCARQLKEAYGVELSGQKLLDVGPGQFLVQTRYFALKNAAVALDFDVIAEHLTPSAFLKMLRYNGILRTVKTLSRKAIGIDRAYERYFQSRFGSIPRVDVQRGDACKMPFPDETFSVVHSRALLHHVEKPVAALSEISRTLKTGGVAYVSLHLYSSFNGSLDPRAMTNDPELRWAHLLSKPTARDGAYLNKLRLSEWKRIFSRTWPGSIVSTVKINDAALKDRADSLLEERKIKAYTREELLTTTVRATWKKQK